MIDNKKILGWAQEESLNGCDKQNILKELIKRRIQILSIRCKYFTGGQETWFGKVSRTLNRQLSREK